MIKCNVAEEGRTSKEELERNDADWDKEAAAEFKPVAPVTPVIPLTPVKQ